MAPPLTPRSSKLSYKRSPVIMSSTREVISCRHLLDQLRTAAPFAQGVVLSTLPRGGLQVAQPLNVSEAIVKAYTEGLHAEDRMTWQAIVRNEPVRLEEVY